jgi:UDP-glucose 4-epimerase
MRVLVTGSSGHLGEALVRALTSDGDDVIGLDLLPAATTKVVGSVADRDVAQRSTRGVDAVVHAATLHKPHVGTHQRQAFIDTNISGTLNLLEAAVENEVRTFVFTSTTSAFGEALSPAPGAPAAWITEKVAPVPKNIYGVTKVAAEDLCQLFQRDYGLCGVVLRVSRFFPEPDDRDEVRALYNDLNLKVNELLYRRVDLEDVVSAHRLALRRASEIGFGRYIISATTPFTPDDLGALRRDAPAVLRRLCPEYEDVYAARGWSMLPTLDRVYVNAQARHDLGWQPRFDFHYALERLRSGQDPRSELALAIGAKGYHAEPTGVYTSGR